MLPAPAHDTFTSNVPDPFVTETSSLHLDALRHLKQINTHLVAAAAYPVLESKGELLPSRLRQDD